VEYLFPSALRSFHTFDVIHPPTVLLFLKAPRPGFVKTRLAATLGEEKACTVYREIAEKTFKKIPSNWSKTIYFTPTDAEPEMKDWLGDTPSFLPQSEGELGHRLLAACEETFTGGASGVILLGGDCPCITEKHLEECATEMASVEHCNRLPGNTYRSEQQSFSGPST